MQWIGGLLTVLAPPQRRDFSVPVVHIRKVPPCTIPGAINSTKLAELLCALQKRSLLPLNV